MNDAPESLQIVEREVMLVGSWNPKDDDWEQYDDPMNELESTYRRRMQAWTAVISIYNPMCKHYGYEERLQQFAFTPWDEPVHEEMSRLNEKQNND